ncbi:MAG: hypothetical protein MZV49_00050 [Rhodopseudomonas palustris]|nr:hypothetical protein [Rhodopseudomonas palustris]
MSLSPATVVVLAASRPRLGGPGHLVRGQRAPRASHLVTKPLDDGPDHRRRGPRRLVPVPPVYKTLVLAGLVFSLLGDVALMFPDKWFHGRAGRFPRRAQMPLHPGLQAAAGPSGSGLATLLPYILLRPADVLPAGPQARPDEGPRLRLHRRHHDDGRVRGGPLRRHGRRRGRSWPSSAGSCSSSPTRSWPTTASPRKCPGPGSSSSGPISGPAPDRPVDLNRASAGSARPGTTRPSIPTTTFFTSYRDARELHGHAGPMRSRPEQQGRS